MGKGWGTLLLVALLGVGAELVSSQVRSQSSFGGTAPGGQNGCNVVSQGQTLGKFSDGVPWLSNTQRDFRNFVCSIFAAAGGSKPNFRVITDSRAVDTSVSTDFVIAWNKGTGSPSTQNIPNCDGTSAGNALTIVDEKGDSATNNIIVIPLGGTISQNSSLTMNSGFMSVTLVCDGISNWVIF